MALKEGKLLKQWLKRKRRITEALIVTFLITGGVAFGQLMGLSDEEIKHLEEGDYYIKIDEQGNHHWIKIGKLEEHEEKAHADETNFRLGKNARYSLPYKDLDSITDQKEHLMKNTYQTAIGADAQTWGGNATAIGSQTIAVGINSTAIGAHSRTYNDSATALGASARAYGNGTVAFGSNAAAIDTYSIGIGSEAKAIGDSSISLGALSLSKANSSIAVGTKSISENEGAISIGSEDEDESSSDELDTENKSIDIKDGLGGLESGNERYYYSESKIKKSLTYAKGKDSIAIGRKAHAEANEAIAIGREAMAENNAANSVSIGSKSKVKQQNGVAIGSEAEANGQNSIVIGKGSKVKKLADMKGIDENGSNQSEDKKAKVTKEVLERLKKKSTVAASSSQATDSNPLEASVILGAVSLATGQYGVTLGHQVHNYGDDGIAVGNQALVSGHGGVAIGKWAGAYQDKSLALGYDVEAHSVNGIAIGTGAIEKGNQGIAIGNLAKSKGNNSIAIGTNATVGNGKMDDMEVSHEVHKHQDDPALGIKEVENAVAIGNNAKVTHSNHVALGANSEDGAYEKIGKVEITPLSMQNTAVVVGNGKIDIPTDKFAGMKKANGNSSYGVVSIGKKDNERQLQHVAAGRISQESTDAINGSQLFAVASYLSSGWKITNGNGFVGDVSLGKQVSFVGENGTKVTVEKDNGNGYKVKISSPKMEHEGLDFMGNDGKIIHRKLGQTLRIKGEGLTREKSEKFRSATGNINVKQNGKSILEVQLAKDLRHIESISNGGEKRGTKITLENGRKEVNVNQAKITNVAAGTHDTDAVNVSQLNKEIAASKAEIKEGKNIQVTKMAGTDGRSIYEVGLKDKVTLGKDATKQIVVDGETGKLKVGDKVSLDGTTGSADFGKVKVNGEAGTVNGLTNKTWNPNSFTSGQAATEDQLKIVDEKIEKIAGNINESINKGLNFGADQGKDVHRNLGDTQKIVGDKKNITTSITETGDLKVELNKKIEVEKLSIPKKEGGEAASISSENGVGTLYLAGKPGKDGKSTGAKISVEEGSAGVEAKDPKKETMERIVYQDSKGNSHTVATHDDGLKFQGDDGKTVNKKLNETLSITGGEQDPNKLSQGNIGVVSTENGGLTIQLAKELKDLSKITLIDGNGNKAVIDGKGLVFEGKDGKKTQLTSNGLDNGGNRITHVAAGKEPTDAVNVSQLNEVKGAVQQNAHRIDKMNGEMRRGLASAAAMSGLEFMEIGINQGTVAAAVGGWKGTQAVAVGVQGAPTENIRINGKVSVAPGYKQVDTMYSVGASYRFNWK